MSNFKQKIKSVEESLTFDDLLIKPSFSSISLKEVDLDLRLNDRLTLQIPVFSAGMDTVTEYEMARSMILAGGCGPLHKNLTVDRCVEMIAKLHEEFGDDKPIAACVGVGIEEKDLARMVEAGMNVAIVDSAHAHTKTVGELVKLISSRFPEVYLIAGNIVTEEGAEWLISNGADAVKVGIGPGSICTTRKVTGIGRGQATSVTEVADYCKSRGVLVIADGGIRSPDEIMKAIACGADAVMLGYLFAGCEECPGEILNIDGKQYKMYRGMGSLSAMKAGSASRYGKEGVENFKWIPEGVESYVPYQGSVKDKLHNIKWSLKSAFGYVGASNISEAQSKSNLVKITTAVRYKSNVHGLEKIKE